MLKSQIAGIQGQSIINRQKQITELNTHFPNIYSTKLRQATLVINNSYSGSQNNYGNLLLIENNLSNFKRSEQKTKTFAVHKHSNSLINMNTLNQSKQQKLYEPNIFEKKMILMLGLIENFIQEYKIIKQKDKQIQREKNKRCMLMTKNLQFQFIQPISQQKIQFDQAFKLFSLIKQKINSILQNNIQKDKNIKKQALIKDLKETQIVQNFSQIEINPNIYQKNFIDPSIKYPNELNLSIHANSTKFNRDERNQNVFLTRTENLKNNSFRNKQKYLNFQNNITEKRLLFKKLQSNKCNKNSQFLIHDNSIKKIKSSKLFDDKKINSIRSKKSNFKIKPLLNKFEVRKKEQIRLFLNFNQTTEHLQNFKTHEGKFFKFNQNLKIVADNLNMCRIVLINRINIMIDYLSVCENDKFADQSQKKKDNQIRPNKQNLSLNIKNSQSVSNFKNGERITSTLQKAIRIKNYMIQSQQLFDLLQNFLMELFRNDQNHQYQDKLKQYRSKNKSNNNNIEKPSTKSGKFLDNFIQRCSDITESIKLYFTTLNHFKFNQEKVKNFNVNNVGQIDKKNKNLIQLRYVLIYLQKQCENSSQILKFRTNNLSTVQCNLKIQKNNIRTNDQTQIQQPYQNIRHSQTIPLNNGQSISLIKINRSTLSLKNKLKEFRIENKENNNMNGNLIWKKFYDKKFTSHTVKLKIY